MITETAFYIILKAVKDKQEMFAISRRCMLSNITGTSSDSHLLCISWVTCLAGISVSTMQDNLFVLHCSEYVLTVEIGVALTPILLQLRQYPQQPA